MATPKPGVQRLLLRCAVPVLCSVVIGILFSGTTVFDRHYGAFQFLWSAVVASVFYHLLIHFRSRDAWLGLIILFGLTLLTTQSSRPEYILRDIFYVAAIAASVLLYVTSFRQGIQRMPVYPAFIIAGMYGIINIAAMEVHLWILGTFVMESTGGDSVSLASTGAYFGTLIGFAVGAGIAINEWVASLKNGQGGPLLANRPELPEDREGPVC